MRNRRLLFTLTFLIILGWSAKSFSLKEDTHRTINEYIAENTVNGFSLNSYLMSNLGFKKGFNEILKGPDADGRGTYKEVSKWLGYGGEQEDRPGSILDYALNKQSRSNNHFHNPLKPWNEAGLNDTLLVPKLLPYPPYVDWQERQFTGQSSVLWAQNPKQRLGGNWSWQDARRYFYIALTGKNLDGTEVAKTQAERDAYFAYTFRAVGQQMHLVEDASVPAHVRNDAHPEDSLGIGYESAMEYFRTDQTKYGSFWGDILSSPISFDRSILDIPSTHPSATVSISRIIDTDKYDGDNPDITKTLFNSPQVIGIAEYTNANFMSKDTIFETDTLHNFYYPRTADTIEWMDNNKRTYLKKIGGGDIADHLARTSWLYAYRMRYFPQYTKYLPVSLDTECYKDYASKLIPRAVGYSAGLLNYFFRGDIRLSYVTDPTPGYVIVNNGSETLDGTFSVYYDNKDDERILLVSGKNKTGSNGIFDLMTPTDAKEPGKYIVVFRGKIGNEDGAVAGYVFSRRLEITPPSQYVYSIADANQEDPEFTSIRLKVRNTKPAEAIQSGTIQAVATYKTDIGDAGFTHSVSTSQTIGSLAADQGTEVDFNFKDDPIPVDAADLYLQVIFKGTIGSETDAVAIGVKDISEPTPIDVFNNMDMVCMSGSWYVAGSPEAIATIGLDGDAYSHNLKDLYVKISPLGDLVNASPTDYTLHVSSLEAGNFFRAYVLSDYQLNHSDYVTTVPTVDQDKLDHSRAILEGKWGGSAVKNQDDFYSDKSICSQAGLQTPCSIRHSPAYYPFRGRELWGSAGIIFDNPKYPPDTNCSWELLQ